MTSFAFEQL